jgi:hypothetical protein
MTEITVKTTLHELDISLLEKLKNLFAEEAIVQIRISNVHDETAPDPPQPCWKMAGRS